MSPLTATAAAIDDGARTRAQIALRTGLSGDVVDAAVDHLLRIGRVATLSLKSSCPSGGCHGCGAPTGTGCGPAPVSIDRNPGT